MAQYRHAELLHGCIVYAHRRAADVGAGGHQGRDRLQQQNLQWIAGQERPHPVTAAGDLCRQRSLAMQQHNGSGSRQQQLLLRLAHPAILPHFFYIAKQYRKGLLPPVFDLPYFCHGWRICSVGAQVIAASAFDGYHFSLPQQLGSGLYVHG